MSYHSRLCAIPDASSRNDFDPACTCGQAARNAAYLASKVQPNAAELARGRELADEGFCQVSRKYRRVVRVPSSGAWAELERVAPHEARRLERLIEQQKERDARAALWHYGETCELDAGTFEAFRRARLDDGEVVP